MQMQATKQNVDKTTRCKYTTCKGERKEGRKSQIKSHDASVKQARGKESRFGKPRENHTMQVYDMQRGKKTDVGNHRKAGDARRKIENKGPTACMGVKACVGGNKCGKLQAKCVKARYLP